VETIEGLSPDGELHALQQAFLEHGAVQCGYCTPGLIMTSKALLDEKAAAGESVTAQDIKIALKDTYCRCTGYQSVIHAVLQASGHPALHPGNTLPRPGGRKGAAQPGCPGED